MAATVGDSSTVSHVVSEPPYSATHMLVIGTMSFGRNRRMTSRVAGEDWLLLLLLLLSDVVNSYGKVRFALDKSLQTLFGIKALS